MGKILILDGQQRNVLSCVRSLAKAGHETTVGSFRKDALCFSSRYTGRTWHYPDPSENSALFWDALLEELKARAYDLVLPFIDVTTRVIVENQEEIRKHAPILVPPIEQFHLAFDKALTFQLAQSLQIPAPVTCYPETLDEAVASTDKTGFPVVIKPRQSSGSRGLNIVRRPQDFPEIFSRVHEKYPRPILQEFIPLQDAVGFVALYDSRTRLMACCQHRRLHEFPLSGGPSTLRETISDKRLTDFGTTILEKLRWTGPAMVEFRVDARDGIPKLMEINPRLWGSIALHIAAGINFPDLIYKLANDIAFAPQHDYHVGTRAKWLLPGEILYFLASLKKGKIEPDALKWWGPDMVLDIVSKDDPLPAFAMIRNIFTSLFSIKTLKHAIFRN